MTPLCQTFRYSRVGPSKPCRRATERGTTRVLYRVRDVVWEQLSSLQTTKAQVEDEETCSSYQTTRSYMLSCPESGDRLILRCLRKVVGT